MWNEARTINRLANTLAVLAVLAMLAGGIYWLIQRPQFELQAIEIEPAPNSTLHYVTPASIQNAIAGNLTGNFFTINLVDAQKVFEDAPWVRSASVRRIIVCGSRLPLPVSPHAVSIRARNGSSQRIIAHD